MAQTYPVTLELDDDTAVALIGGLNFLTEQFPESKSSGVLRGLAATVMSKFVVAKVSGQAQAPSASPIQGGSGTTRQPCRPGCAVNHAGYDASAGAGLDFTVGDWVTGTTARSHWASRVSAIDFAAKTISIDRSANLLDDGTRGSVSWADPQDDLPFEWGFYKVAA